MVKSGQSLTPFSRDRLFITVYESCKHRKAAASDAGALTQIVISQAAKRHKGGIILHEDIIQTTLQVLKRFDQVAATMYAAYNPSSA